MKIKFFKKGNSFKKKDFNLNPNFYWKFAVIFTFISIIASFFFSYRLFVEIDQESAPLIINVEERVPIIKEDSIKNTLFYFTEKEQKSLNILKAPSPVVDPSL